MTRFDRFLLKRLFLTYLGILLPLIPFYCVLDLAEHLDDFTQNGATWKQVITVYYPSLVAEIIRLMSPLALILGVIFITLRLVKTQQLTAIYTAGISFIRILWVYCGFGIVVTLFMMWFGNWIVPEANAINNKFADQYLNASSFDPEGDVKQVKRYAQLSETAFLEIESFDEVQKTAFQPFWVKRDSLGQIRYRMDAELMRYEAKQGVWVAQRGVERIFEGKDDIKIVPFVEKKIKIPLLPDDFKFNAQKIAELNAQESKAFIERQKQAGTGNVARQQVDYYGRFGWAFSNFVVIFVALALAARRKKYENAVVIGTGLLIAFAYLLAVKLIEPFANTGELPVWMAVLFPHLLFLSFGIWGIAKIEQ